MVSRRMCGFNFRVQRTVSIQFGSFALLVGIHHDCPTDIVLTSIPITQSLLKKYFFPVHNMMNAAVHGS